MKVSVLMIAYNHEKYIGQAIEGVLSQKTSFDIELIIANDCSTDNSDSIISNYLEQNDQIKYYSHPENIGMHLNFKFAYSKSRGDYIALCEGDDYWIDPLKLQKQVDFLENNQDHTLLFTRFKVKQDSHTALTDDENGRYFKDSESSIVFDFDIFKSGWYGGTLTCMFRASALKLNDISKYKYFRDVHLYVELLKKGNGACLNFFGAVYRIHKGGVYSSSTLLERAKTASLCYKELYIQNQDVPALEIKFRYFHREYIKELNNQKKYFKALGQALLFGLLMKDIRFVITESKRIMRNTWFSKFIRKKDLIAKKDSNFPGSQEYWEERYRSKSNSGAGSYGRLAEFKAERLNTFVKDHAIQSIIEFGSGDGNQLSLAKYPNYIGFDVSEKALELCRERFRTDKTKSFYSMEDEIVNKSKAELTLSLDVLYHLIEDEVFDAYMNRLFSTSTKYVIIYSSNYDDHFVAHVKCREFTRWITKNVSNNWNLIDYIKNAYPFDKSDPNNTSMADFYIYQKIN